jgi:hypothetical protein
MLGHKANLNRYKKFEIIPYIPAEHKGIKIEVSGRENHKKHSNSLRLNNTLLIDQ